MFLTQGRIRQWNSFNIRFSFTAGLARRDVGSLRTSQRATPANNETNIYRRLLKKTRLCLNVIKLLCLTEICDLLSVKNTRQTKLALKCQ